VILSSNNPTDITNAHCCCGSPINKLLCGLCKTKSPDAFTHAVRLPKFPAKSSLEPAPSSSAPRSLRAIIMSSQEPTRCRRVFLRAAAPSFPTMVESLYTLSSSLTKVGDAIDHTGSIPKPTTLFLSPQQCHHPRVYDAVDPHRPKAHNVIVLPEPATPSTHTVPEFIAPSSSSSL
jgi:hypothetical protein